MARTNYSFERRQRDLARKKKAEEKLARKVAKSKEKHGTAPTEAADVETQLPETQLPLPPDAAKEG